MKDFIAFGIIAQIDNILGQSLQPADWGANPRYRSRDIVKSDFDFFSEKTGRGRFYKGRVDKCSLCLASFQLAIYKLMRLFYNAFYFYFIPLSVTMLTFFLGKPQDTSTIFDYNVWIVKAPK